MRQLLLPIVGLMAVLALIPAAAQAQRRHEVTVDSMPQGATVYLEAKEAGPQGYTPHVFRLEPGSYTFMLEAPGYEPFQRTVKIRRQSTFTFTLERRSDPAQVAVKGASGGNADGADVLVNGKRVGAVPLTVTLQPGRYLVEVKREGFHPYSRWVDVKLAETRTFEVKLTPTDRATGTVLVSANIVGAEVFLDGEKVDTSPALLRKLAPGVHVVEIKARGYLPARKEIRVEAGRTDKLIVELDPDAETLARTSGTLMVLASHKEVRIKVDGEDRGVAPVKITGLAEGSHVVEATREGYSSAEETVELKKGQLKTVKLTLNELPPVRRTGALRVVSKVRGAQVLIDGVLQGKTPLLRHQLDPGPHFVTVRKQGFHEVIKTAEVKAGQITEVRVALERRTPTSAPASAPSSRPAADEPPRRELTSYAAELVPPTRFTVDAAVGFPWIFSARVTTGIFAKDNLAMDAGVHLGTWGAMTEIGLHTRFRLLRRGRWSAATMLAVGGGGGSASRSTVYVNLGGLGSVRLFDRLSVTGRAYFNVYTDRHCPETAEANQLEICSGTVEEVGQDPRDRFTGLRFIISAAIEVDIHERINVHGIIEGAPFQGNRRAFYDAYASVMPETDPGVYGRVGGTFKF